MSVIMYKQRHNTVNTKGAAGLHAAHIRYIGTRPGASFLNDEHALFGALKGFGDVRDCSLEEIAAHIYQKSKAGTLMFRSILSMRNEDARCIHVEDADDWRSFLRRSLPILSERNRIDFTDLSWVGAVHEKAGERHVHVLFFDASDRVHSDFVPPARVSRIRTELIQLHFKERIREHLKVSDYQKEQLLSDAKEVLVRLLKGDENSELVSSLSHLMQAIPRRGRIAERFFPEEAKAALHQTAHLLLRSTKEMEEASLRYLESKMPIGSMMGGAESVHRERYLGEIEAIARRAILRSIREHRKEHSSWQDGEHLGGGEEGDNAPFGRNKPYDVLSIVSRSYFVLLSALETPIRDPSFAATKQNHHARRGKKKRDDRTR